MCFKILIIFFVIALCCMCMPRYQSAAGSVYSGTALQCRRKSLQCWWNDCTDASCNLQSLYSSQCTFLCVYLIVIAEHVADCRIAWIRLSLCTSTVTVCICMLMKLCAVVLGPESKNVFVRGNPSSIAPVLAPIMHFQWEGLNTAVTLWQLLAQMMCLGFHYIRAVVVPELRQIFWSRNGAPVNVVGHRQNANTVAFRQIR